MPALPPVPGVIRVVQKHTLQEDVDVVNHQYFSYSSAAPIQADLDSLATAAWTSWNTNLMALLAAELIHTDTIATDLGSALGLQSIHTGTLAGSDATATLGAGTALVVKFHVRRRYRGGHPRNYLAGVTQQHLADVQTWTAGTLTAFTDGFDAYIDDIEAHAFGALVMTLQANVSWFEGFTNFTFPSGRVRALPKLRVGGPIVDVISTISVNPKLASQRRRNLQSV